MRHRRKCQKGVVRCAKSDVVVEIIGQKGKILTSTQGKHKPTLKAAESGCNLIDNKSHKIQYNDPVIGNFHILLISIMYTYICGWSLYNNNILTIIASS